ncbi:MAG: hypothetical protein AAFQ43_11035, partial [Bacteroidota bacterium]
SKGGRPQQNFVLYAERACKTLQALGLDTTPIDREIKKHLSLVQRMISGKSRRSRGVRRRGKRRKRPLTT